MWMSQGESVLVLLLDQRCALWLVDTALTWESSTRNANLFCCHTGPHTLRLSVYFLLPQFLVLSRATSLFYYSLINRNQELSVGSGNLVERSSGRGPHPSHHVVLPYKGLPICGPYRRAVWP